MGNDSKLAEVSYLKNLTYIYFWNFLKYIMGNFWTSIFANSAKFFADTSVYTCSMVPGVQKYLSVFLNLYNTYYNYSQKHLETRTIMLLGGKKSRLNTWIMLTDVETILYMCSKYNNYFVLRNNSIIGLKCQFATINQKKRG